MNSINSNILSIVNTPAPVRRTGTTFGAPTGCGLLGIT